MWNELLFDDATPLSNFPEITLTSETKDPKEGDSSSRSAIHDNNGFRVVAKNTGLTTLDYYSGGKHKIQLFQEIYDGKKWKSSNWDWCGTGKSSFQIAPNESVELEVEFWDDSKRERVLAVFSEVGTNRAGLVVLATEPEK